MGVVNIGEHVVCSVSVLGNNYVSMGAWHGSNNQGWGLKGVKKVVAAKRMNEERYLTKSTSILRLDGYKIK